MAAFPLLSEAPSLLPGFLPLPHIPHALESLSHGIVLGEHKPNQQKVGKSTVRTDVGKEQDLIICTSFARRELFQMSVFKFTGELETSQVYKWGGSGGNTVWDTLQLPVSEKREMLGKLPCH